MRPAPAAPRGWLGQLLDGTDLFLALIGTGLGALAGYLSATFLPRFSPQLQLPPFALALAVGVAAVLASLIVLVAIVYWVATDRASRKRMQLKQLVQKEKAFFMEIDNDTSVLAGPES